MRDCIFAEYCDQPPEVLDQISEAWFKIENDVATDHFYSNIEDLESFIKRVKSIEPDYIDDYVKIYMKAGKDIKIENKTCLPLVLTLGGLYLTSTSFGRNVLKVTSTDLLYLFPLSLCSSVFKHI